MCNRPGEKDNNNTRILMFSQRNIYKKYHYRSAFYEFEDIIRQVDLVELLAQTDNEYIIQVYSNLLAGSENHLRAFVSNLERQTGEGYQPVYLDQDAYQAIINGAAERGGDYRRKGHAGDLRRVPGGDGPVQPRLLRRDDGGRRQGARLHVPHPHDKPHKGYGLE